MEISIWQPTFKPVGLLPFLLCLSSVRTTQRTTTITKRNNPSSHRYSSRNHTVTPYLAIKNAVEALECSKKAFGAVETFRLMMPDGRLALTEIRLGDSMVVLRINFPNMMAESRRKHWAASQPAIHLYVDDVDAFFQRALAAGAKERKAVMDEFYGDRSGQLEYPFRAYLVGTYPKETVWPEEMQKRLQAMIEAS